MINEPYENKHPGTDGDPSHSGIIRNRKLALIWLKKNGWRASRSSLYRHIKEGRLPMAKSGTIDADDLRIYASAYLQPTTPPPDCKVVAGLLEIEKQAQIKLLQTREEKLRFEHDLMKNQYLLRDDVHLAWSIRLGFLETHLKGLFRTSAESWLMACGADPAAGGVLFGLMEKELDELLEYLGNLEELRVVVKKRPINEN